MLTDILSELMRRQQLRGLIDDCHASQRQLVDAIDAHPYVAGLMARRQGKTEGVLRYAVYRCLSTPGYRVAWGEDFSQAGWDDIIPLMVGLSRQYGFAYQTNGQLHEIRLGQGSTIRCYGVRQDRFASLIRGKQYDLWILDEAQRLYDVDLTSLVNSVIVHTLSDRRGHLALTGTPGDVDAGLFYAIIDHHGAVMDAAPAEEGDEGDELAQRERQLASMFRLVEGQPFGNPTVATQQREQLDAYRAINPDIESEPWVQRELFGRWVCDRAGLVIPLLPSRNYLYGKDAWTPHPDDIYLLGMDYGYSPDPCAFVVATCNPRRHPDLIYLEGETAGQLLDHEVNARVADYARRYPGIHRCMDPGGGGKSTIETLNQVYAANVAPAQKADKRATVRSMRSDATLGRIKVYNVHDPDHPERSAIAVQWSKLMWVRSRRGVLEEGRPRHLHDAATYLYRSAQHHAYRPTVEPQSPKEKRIRDLRRRERRRREMCL